MRFLRLSCSPTASNRFQRFNCSSGVYTAIYSVTTGVSSNDLGVGSNGRAGTKANVGSVLIGQKIRRVTFFLKKTGSPTGTITFSVRNDDGSSTLKTTFGTMNASALTTSFAQYTFTASSSYTLVVQDVINVEFTGGGASNNIQIQRLNTDGFDGTATHRSTQNIGTNNWTDTTTEDFNGIYYSST